MNVNVTRIPLEVTHEFEGDRTTANIAQALQLPERAVTIDKHGLTVAVIGDCISLTRTAINKAKGIRERGPKPTLGLKISFPIDFSLAQLAKALKVNEEEIEILERGIAVLKIESDTYAQTRIQIAGLHRISEISEQKT